MKHEFVVVDARGRIIIDNFELDTNNTEIAKFQKDLVYLMADYKLLFMFLTGLALRYDTSTLWGKQIGTLTTGLVKKLKTLKMS